MLKKKMIEVMQKHAAGLPAGMEVINDADAAGIAGGTCQNLQSCGTYNNSSGCPSLTECIVYNEYYD